MVRFGIGPLCFPNYKTVRQPGKFNTIQPGLPRPSPGIFRMESHEKSMKSGTEMVSDSILPYRLTRTFA